MFEHQIAVLSFQLGHFEKIVADLPEECMDEAFPGHGHTPAWILGHLALVGEAGNSLLGGTLTHPEWKPIFGGGSDGLTQLDSRPSRDELLAAIRCGYQEVMKRVSEVDPAHFDRPHQFGLFEGTPVKTIGDLMTVLMTNHFGFHLAQLSSCRRSRGLDSIF